MWTKSACVVLAWSILLILVVAVGMKGSVHPAQANIRIASSTTNITPVGTRSVAAARPTARYVVQPGDTLSGIAARFAVRGGWPTLYAANRPLIGPDPNDIHPGTVLVLPGQTGPVRYTVAAGDTLSGIAAALAVHGGWPALYAANQRVIGPDPSLIRPGTVLAVPRPGTASRSASSSGRRWYPTSPSAPTGSQHHPSPGRTRAPVSTGMPQWLKTMLLAVGLLIGAAFLAEAVLQLWRRRRQVATLAAEPQIAQPRPVKSGQETNAGQETDAGQQETDAGQRASYGQCAAEKPRIVLADYDRLVVTHSQPDGTIYVLRPPGEDPAAILRVARLVLPEGPYRELAGQLGMPSSWPIVMADYDRLVVTCTKCDDTVYVLRPPGEDPAEILRAARLVLPEGPYGELADQLGIPASWPME
jgi:LysM repeat protein